MIYGYARVSTKGQARDGNSLDGQATLLKEAGATKIYYDSFTGRKMDRPEFDKLKSVLKSGDKLIVTKLDRFARSAAQGSQLIESLIEHGITVHVLNIGVMDNTPTGKLIRNIMLSFAVDGRPSLDLPRELFQKFREKQKGGEMTVEECCEELNISRSSWYKYLKCIDLQPC